MKHKTHARLDPKRVQGLWNRHRDPKKVAQILGTTVKRLHYRVGYLKRAKGLVFHDLRSFKNKLLAAWPSAQILRRAITFLQTAERRIQKARDLLKKPKP